MSSHGPRITTTFGYGGASPKVTNKLGSVSIDQSGQLASGGIEGPLPLGRKSVYVENNSEDPLSFFLFTADGGSQLLQLVVPVGRSIMVPADADAGWFVAPGSEGNGRVLVLQ